MNDKLKKIFSLVVLLFFCKFSFAQKINLPDSLPFTLEYIDSTTYANAVDICPLTIDTLNFLKKKNSLILYDSNEIVLSFGEYNKELFCDSLLRDSTADFFYVGYFIVNGKKWFLVGVENCFTYYWEGKNYISLLFKPPYLSAFKINSWDFSILNNGERFVEFSRFNTAPWDMLDIRRQIEVFKIKQSVFEKEFEYDFYCEDESGWGWFDEKGNRNCPKCFCPQMTHCKTINENVVYAVDDEFDGKNHFVKLILKK